MTQKNIFNLQWSPQAHRQNNMLSSSKPPNCSHLIMFIWFYCIFHNLSTFVKISEECNFVNCEWDRFLSEFKKKNRQVSEFAFLKEHAIRNSWREHWEIVTSISGQYFTQNTFRLRLQLFINVWIIHKKHHMNR